MVDLPKLKLDENGLFPKNEKCIFQYGLGDGIFDSTKEFSYGPNCSGRECKRYKLMYIEEKEKVITTCYEFFGEVRVVETILIPNSSRIQKSSNTTIEFTENTKVKPLKHDKSICSYFFN